MSENKSYSEKLKDPRWQKKRLEIFNRDKWICKICGDTLDTLIVHHKLYINGNDPWDYDNEHLITLCNTCHIVIENTKRIREDFDFEKVRAYCILDEENAISFYRYDNRPVIIISKRGSSLAATTDDCKKLIDIFKNGKR